MTTHEGHPALTGIIRHYHRGFYVIDLVDPDPVHAHLDPVYLRGSQFTEGLPRADGTRVTLQYTVTGSSGLWCVVAAEPVEFRINPETPPLTMQADLVLDALTRARDLLGYSTLDEVREARDNAPVWPNLAPREEHLRKCDTAEAVLRALACLPRR